MIRLSLALILILVGATPLSAAPPEGLKGKSVVVSWTENRVRRLEGESGFRPATVNMGLSAYVSTQGRVFNRMKSNSGSNDQIAGQTGDSAQRVPDFNGRSMTVTQQVRGMTRRISVEFDPGYSSCTVRVAIDKGAGAAFVKGFGTGRRQEIQSISATDASCSVRAGNVFGE
jgi:hypothetical protein